MLQLDVNIHTVDPPLSPAEQAAEPLDAETRPLGALGNYMVGGCTDERLGRGAGHVYHCRVERRGRIAAARPWLEPVTAEVEEASVGPVTRRQEQDEEQDRAVDAGAVEEVGADEEEEDEGRRGVGWYEQEGEPAVKDNTLAISCIK